MKAFHDTGRHNTNDSKMPPSCIQHDASGQLPRFDLRQRLIKDGRFEFPSPVIQLIQFLGQRVSFPFRLCRQQAHSFERLIQPPCGVQPRREFKRDRIRRAVTGHAGDLLQGPETTTGSTRNLSQALANKQSIFVLERDHIGDGRQRHQVQQGLEGHRTRAICLLIRLHNFVRETT